MERLLSKDVLAGLMFIGFGVLFLALGADLRLGTPRSMGPGFVPRLLSFAMIGLGAVIAVRAVIARSERTDPVRLRALIMVLLGVGAFVVAFERLGLAPAALALILLASMARPDWRRLETATTILVLVAACIAIFKIGLGMTFPVLAGVW